MSDKSATTKEGTAEGTGTTTTDEGAKNKQTVTPPPEGNQSGANAQSASGFTQDDLNRVAGKAREEGKSAGGLALLRELGVDSVDAAKAALKAAEDAKRAQMTELDKLKADKAAADKAVADAQASAQKAQAEAQAALIRAEFTSLSAGKFNVPVEAVLKLADVSAVKVEDGKVSGVAEALDKVAKDYPALVATAQDKKKVPSIGVTNGKEGAATRTDDERRAEYFGGGRGNDFFGGGGVVTHTKQGG